MDQRTIGIDRPYSDLHTMVEDDRKAVVPVGTTWSDVKRYRDYARGRQKGTLNADQLRVMAAILQNKFADNVLKMILLAHANRLRVARFEVADDVVRDFIFTTWVKNSLPDLFADSIYSLLRDGNHAISLDWKATDDVDDPYGGYVSMSRERWWDGAEGVFMMYDDAGKPSYAVKEWMPVGRGARKRRNIYFPDMIFRFVLESEGWLIFNLDTDPPVINIEGNVTAGPVAWVKRDGSGLGIPVIHLPNGSDDDSYYGASLLAGGPLAFQDQLNAIQHDMSAAAMLNGSPRTFSKGFPLPVDPQTNLPRKVATGPGTHHHADEATAEWGAIPPGSLAELDRAYTVKLNALCRNTDTPLHVITGQWPSGEAIFRAEMPLVQATKKLAESTGPGWSSVMHRSTEIANAFGRGAELNENELIQTVFEPVEQRDELTLWAIAEKASAHVSPEEVLRIVGKSPTEIEAIMSERDAANARKVEQAQAVFNRGAELPLNGNDEFDESE